MKKSMCFLVKKAGFLVLAMLLSGVFMDVNATEPPPLEEETDIPLDGGLSLLLAAGAALGSKKVYDMRKKSKENKS